MAWLETYLTRCFQPFNVKCLFSDFTQRYYQLKKATGPLNKDWELTEDTIRFINMLHTYVRGWDDNEYSIILGSVGCTEYEFY